MKDLLNELAMVCETIKCKNAKNFRMGDLSSPTEIKEALEKIISKHRTRVEPEYSGIKRLLIWWDSNPQIKNLMTVYKKAIDLCGEEMTRDERPVASTGESLTYFEGEDEYCRHCGYMVKEGSGLPDEENAK